MPVNPTPSPVDINTVGLSWTQDNAGNFGVTQVPAALCLDGRSGRSSTTYELPNFDNAMGKIGGLKDWEPGQAFPVERTIGSTSVTFTPRGVQTRIISRPQGRNIQQVFRDLETNLVPVLMSELMLGLDTALYDLLGTEANWDSTVGAGTYAVFTDGAGAPATAALNQYSGNASQPDVDIQTELQKLRKYQGLNGMSLECVTNSHVLDALSRHSVYAGGGAGSGVAAALPRDEFLARFQAIHRLDRIIVMDSVTDTVNAGIASVPNFTANGLLWFGLMDRRSAEMDLRSEGSLDAPAGAVCFAKGREPEVATWASPGMETDSFAGRASFSLFSPRGSDFGVGFQPSGAGGIFGTLPA